MIIAVVGPTAVGKTKMSVMLAKKYDAIIINSDAMQVYRDLNIGTAKVTEEEKEGVPHFLFDIKDVTEDYSIYDYQKDVRKLLEKYKGRNIIFVGGTGLYLKSALYDYDLKKENGHRDYSNYSNEELYNMALEKDINCDIHPNNRVRLERFLDKEKTAIKEPVKLYDHIIIGLTLDREVLYDRINKRVDLMIKDGLLDEVKSFYDKKVFSKPLVNGIGYKELYEYFDGKVSLDQAVNNIKQNSRHYAKRQYTFFNHQLDVNWFNVNLDNFEETYLDVVNFINNGGGDNGEKHN